MFLRVPPGCRLCQRREDLGCFRTEGRDILGHTGVLDEERRPIQLGVCGFGFYGNHILVKADRPCYNGGR